MSDRVSAFLCFLSQWISFGLWTIKLCYKHEFFILFTRHTPIIRFHGKWWLSVLLWGLQETRNSIKQQIFNPQRGRAAAEDDDEKTIKEREQRRRRGRFTWMGIRPHWSGWSPELHRLGAAAPLGSSRTCSNRKQFKASSSHLKQSSAPTLNVCSYLFFFFGIAHTASGCVCSYSLFTADWLILGAECHKTCDWGPSSNLTALQLQHVNRNLFQGCLSEGNICKHQPAGVPEKLFFRDKLK